MANPKPDPLVLQRPQTIEGRRYPAGAVLGEMRGEEIVPTAECQQHGITRGHLQARLYRNTLTRQSALDAQAADAGKRDKAADEDATKSGDKTPAK